jgi:hypothetical protein
VQYLQFKGDYDAQARQLDIAFGNATGFRPAASPAVAQNKPNILAVWGLPIVGCNHWQEPPRSVSGVTDLDIVGYDSFTDKRG